MANEITAYVSLELYSTNNFYRRFGPPGMQVSQANAETYENTIPLTTTDTKLTVSNTSSYGWAYFQNITNATDVVITVGSDSTGVIRPFGRLKPKEWGVFRLIANTTYRAQCESSSGRLLYGIWGD